MCVLFYVRMQICRHTCVRVGLSGYVRACVFVQNVHVHNTLLCVGVCVLMYLIQYYVCMCACMHVSSALVWPPLLLRLELSTCIIDE